jgi:hypothetical protein
MSANRGRALRWQQHRPPTLPTAVPSRTRDGNKAWACAYSLRSLGPQAASGSLIDAVEEELGQVIGANAGSRRQHQSGPAPSDSPRRAGHRVGNLEHRRACRRFTSVNADDHRSGSQNSSNSSLRSMDPQVAKLISLVTAPMPTTATTFPRQLCGPGRQCGVTGKPL